MILIINFRVYFLILVLFISILTTNVIDNDFSDTLLTVVNCFIIIKSYMRYQFKS